MIQTGLKTVGIDHAVLWVSNLEASKKFYIDLLGMTIAHESPHGAFLWCGKQEVILFQTKDGAPVQGGAEIQHMAFRLEDGSYEDVKATLESWGCKVEGRPGDDRCLYFDDPDGHRLQVLTPAEQG